MKKQLKKGFTLTELVIVIVIIAILAAVLIPSMTGYVNRAKKSNATQEAATLYTVYSAWLVDDTDKYGYGQETSQTILDSKTAHAAVDAIGGAAAKPAVTKDSTINRTGADLTIAKADYLKKFAAYICEAQDLAITDVNTDTSITLSNNQVISAVSNTSFTLVSSNGYTVKVTVNDGQVEYSEPTK